MTEMADDRLSILLAQLDSVWEMLDVRLTGRQPFRTEIGSAQSNLTDHEYFWEPVPGCWSIRRRDLVTTSIADGKGDWVMERESPPPQPPPVTTIAWRLCHIALWQLMRHDYTFGSHTLTFDDIVWPGNASDAVDFLKSACMQWRTALDTITTADLDQVGRSQMPHGLDPHVRFVDLLAWTNTELAHHAAEIGCLRDLYRVSTL